MLIVAFITFCVKILSFYKETVIAGTYGLSELLDTFLVAILIPTFVQSVFISSMKNLFIPNYIIELKQNGDKKSFQTIVFLMTLTISVVSIFITLISIDLFLELIFPNHTDLYYDLVKRQLNILLPCLLFWGISNVLSGLLEIENKFLISTFADVIPIITIILFLFLYEESLVEMTLAYGTLTGSFFAFVYLILFSRKLICIDFKAPKINSNSKQMLRQLPPKISSSFLSIMNEFIDQFFAGSLVVGSIAALNYGNRISAFSITIIIMAMGNVLLPHFSRLVSLNPIYAFKYLYKVLKIVFFSSLVIVVILIFASETIITLWLEHGNFKRNDTMKVTYIQQILLFSVPFYLCTRIIVKFLTSINKNRFMAWISLFNLLINVLLNLILIKYYGVYGLALSTTFVLIISAFIYFLFTHKQFKKINYED
ncbi:murein biosynthesis integral membrane protein MurJ [Winogradskyella poriferorum]|uniref:murein biosynthesis integral membrane protein MurJ n=1 Tax=Winogradskyella poriferorum TaxID=307627 RepID=UPI003D648B46